MSYVLAFIGFALLIVLHEAGHFAVAKAVGMRVERFSLFFGPMFVKRRIGETDYGIGVIPLGGYVKITGMSPEEHFATPEIEARAYVNQPVWKRIVVIAAGPGVNLVLAVALATAAIMGLGSLTLTNRVAKVLPRTAAASSALRAGDELVSVDGVRGDAARLHEQIAKHTCTGGEKINGCQATTPATLVIRRHGKLRTLSIRPRWSSADREMLAGFTWYAKTGSNSVAYSAGQSVDELWYVTKRSLTAMAEIFKPKQRKQIHSVVGAYAITANQIASGWINGLWIIAQISLALAIVNLFPFLPLDGGHIFWAVAEKVRGRRIPIAVIERASFVGIALIALLVFIGFSNDISALTGNGLGS